MTVTSLTASSITHPGKYGNLTDVAELWSFLQAIPTPFELPSSPTGEVLPFCVGLSLPLGRLHIELWQLESLACSIQCVSFQRRPDAPSSAATLREQAETLARQITCLLHPLGLIEFDAVEPAFVIRSRVDALSPTPPVSYYELRGDATQVTLERFAKEPRCPRRNVPMLLTRDECTQLGGCLTRL